MFYETNVILTRRYLIGLYKRHLSSLSDSEYCLIRFIFVNTTDIQMYSIKCS